MILSIDKYYYFYWPAYIRPIKDILKINYKPPKKCVFHRLLNVIPIYIHEYMHYLVTDTSNWNEITPYNILHS